MASFNGDIHNPDTNGCIDTLGKHNGGGGHMGAYPCHGTHGTQEFMFGKDGQMRIALADFIACVVSRDDDDLVWVHRCGPQPKPDAGFTYDKVTGLLKEKRTGRCLRCTKEQSEGTPLTLKFAECSVADKGQEWRFKNDVIEVGEQYHERNFPGRV